MSLMRPEVSAALHRWREVIAAGAAAALGLWLLWLGGLILAPLGVAVLLLALGWAAVALRRVRFAQGIGAPGVVEVDEGQVGYLGPTFGGFVALPDLAEIRIAEVRGERLWRLKTADGQVLLIPVAAAGAEALFDAFASLPGIDMGALVAGLEAGTGTLPLWRRPASLDLDRAARQV